MEIVLKDTNELNREITKSFVARCYPEIISIVERS